MAALRRQNWLGQQRVDVPHLRMVEEAVAGDLDALAGQMLTGGIPQILRGFTVIGTTGPASGLSVRVAGGRILHPTASDSGTVYTVDSDEADEPLTATNPHVEGAFVPNAVNFVGLDLVAEADDTTTDVAQFLSTDTLQDSPRPVPLARVLRRRFVISTLDPATTPGLAPIAKITTDAGNNVASIADVRNIMWRLGRGGGNPNPQYAYTWPAGRTDVTDFSSTGGDRQLGSMKDWMDAVMTRLWESAGGERWFTPISDRNIQLTGTGSTFVSSGENFEWTGTNVHWKGLAVIFPNSTGTVNEIADQTTDQSGLTDLADGECVYVDLDFSANHTSGLSNQLVMLKGVTATLGAPAIPGSRMIVLWRRGTGVFYRGKVGVIGATSVPAATTTTLGTVKLSATAPNPASPVVPVLDGSNNAVAAGLTRGGLGGGTLAVGGGANDGTIAVGSTSTTGGVTITGNTGSADLVTVKQNASTVWKLLGQGGQQMPIRTGTPTTPATDNFVFSLRDNGLTTPNRRLQLVVMWPDGRETTLCESEPS